MSKSIPIVKLTVVLQWSLDNALARIGYMSSMTHPVDFYAFTKKNTRSFEGQSVPNQWPLRLFEVIAMVASWFTIWILASTLV